MVQVRKALRTGLIVFGILIALFFVLGLVRPYTDYLWYAHDVRQPQVFSTMYDARGLLFTCSFVVSVAMIYGNLRRALSVTLVYLRRPESSGQLVIGNAIQWVQQQGRSVVRIGAPIFAFFTAIGFSNEWNTFLLWRHGGSFGKTDPMYGLDLGFYVFALPWYRAVVNGAFSLCLLTTILTVGAYVGLQSLALLAKVELGRSGFRWHVSALIGVTVLVFALQTWLKTYEAGLMDSGQFTGAGYASVQAVAVTRIFAMLAGLVGVATIAGARWGRPYSIPMAGGIALVVFYFAGVVAYPGLVERFVVSPNRLVREAPYAARAISMTRFAYGLENIEVRDFHVRSAPTTPEVQTARATLDNMRLWDPEVLRQSLERQQVVRPYYAFPDVDIDRYTLDGRQTMVMLGPRDLNLDGLDPAARNWTNERLRYTHGYGLTVSLVNAATPDGEPVFLADDIPEHFSPQLPITQPRLYFDDMRTSLGEAVDQYAIVDTAEPELDYQTPTASLTSEWDGNRGIPIGGLVTRLAFSIALGDGNLLVSGNVTPNSRLLIHRNVLDRAKKVYPFLKFDSDPYVVVLNGRPIWVLDGYTLTDMIPYSARLESAEGAFNYLRNPVKVTIDADTGAANAYAIDASEPILNAYRSIYPGLVQDASQVPEGLAAHFRYPEGQFSLQSAELTNYHVTDPTSFLSNADAWDIAAERDLSGSKAPMQPYYVEMQLPDEPQPQFVLILPFTPHGRQTMSGWMAAHCDPGRYGMLTLYRFATGVPISGPELMEGNFTTTPEISNINRQYNNDQSEIVVGNLLVIPIGHSVMFAEPLYLRSKAAGIQAAPRLFRVILAFNDRIVVGATYAEALQKLFGSETPATPTPAAPGGPTKPGGPAPAVPTPKQALDLLNQAEAALRAGDFAKYGDLQKRLKTALESLAR